MSAKLDAVNVMLKAIGETPVSSLSSGLADAAQAEATLDTVKRRILAKGWTVNTDNDVTFNPDVNQEIRVADTVLRIDTSDEQRFIDVVIRVDPNDQLRKLFDKREQSFQFTRSLKCDVIYDYEFDELDFDLQQYIAAQAARKFQEETMGSVALDKFLVRAEGEAWASFQDAEAEAEDVNTITDSPHVRAITFRNSRLRGF